MFSVFFGVVQRPRLNYRSSVICRFFGFIGAIDIFRWRFLGLRWVPSTDCGPLAVGVVWGAWPVLAPFGFHRGYTETSP